MQATEKGQLYFKGHALSSHKPCLLDTCTGGQHCYVGASNFVHKDFN